MATLVIAMAAPKEKQNLEKVLVVMDCVVFGFFNSEVKTLLVQGNGITTWNVISDVIRNETVEETAQRALSRLPGLKATHLEQLKVYTNFNRYGEKRVIVVTLCAIVRSDHPETVAVQPGYQWFAFCELPAMDAHFQSMFLEAKKKLREIASVFFTMAPLLPQKFTITQLQRIYESINEMRLDKGNFSKRFFSANILKRLDEKNVKTSKKGSFYYEFDMGLSSNGEPKTKLNIENGSH